MCLYQHMDMHYAHLLKNKLDKNNKKFQISEKIVRMMDELVRMMEEKKLSQKEAIQDRQEFGHQKDPKKLSILFSKSTQLMIVI